MGAFAWGMEENRNKCSLGQTKQSMGEWRERGARSRRGQVMMQATASAMFQGGIAGGRSHGGGLVSGNRDVISYDKARETQTQPRRHGARVTKVELTAHETKAKTGFQKTPVEPVQPRTTVEPEGRWSPVEPKEWREEVQPAARNSMVEPG